MARGSEFRKRYAPEKVFILSAAISASMLPGGILGVGANCRGAMREACAAQPGQKVAAADFQKYEIER